MVEKTEKISKEVKEVRKLLMRWTKIVDDPKKKKVANKIFDRIWEIKRGNIRPF